MKYEIGAVIRFKYTGDRASILKDNLDGSFMVRLEKDGDEIVAFADDILLAHLYKGTEQSEYMQRHAQKSRPLTTEELFFSKTELQDKARKELSGIANIANPNPQPSASEAANNPPAHHYVPSAKSKKLFFQHTAPTNSGVFLSFVMDSEDHYTTYLVNDTNFSVFFEYELYLNDYLKHDLKHTIPPNSFFAIGELYQAQFNDAPIIDILSRRLGIDFTLKIKYKSFIKSKNMTPLMGIESFMFQVWDGKPKTEQAAAKKPSLSEYTAQNVDINAVKELAKRRQQAEPTPSELKAAFPLDIDLHIEKLMPDTYKQLALNEVMNIQIKAMEDYLYKAVKVGVEKVYIIHGIGEGKLKENVDQRLSVHPLVQKHHNKYYPEYGFGATEVFLK